MNRLLGLFEPRNGTHHRDIVQQPQTAQVTAALDLSNSWELRGDITTAHLQLTPWLESATFSFTNTQLHLTMNDAGVHVVGDLTVPEWQTPALHVDAQ